MVGTEAEDIGGNLGTCREPGPGFGVQRHPNRLENTECFDKYSQFATKQNSLKF